jgi:opacity protein-like surface antigen
MKRILLAAVIIAFAGGSAMAASCDTMAVSKDGKPLSGAAKTAFVKKCKADACEPKAVGKDGKPLSGAAKTSFMKKCEEGA